MAAGVCAGQRRVAGCRRAQAAAILEEAEELRLGQLGSCVVLRLLGQLQLGRKGRRSGQLGTRGGLRGQLGRWGRL
jgi:hypothetical protein